MGADYDYEENIFLIVIMLVIIIDSCGATGPNGVEDLFISVPIRAHPRLNSLTDLASFPVQSFSDDRILIAGRVRKHLETHTQCGECP
jgi:hypothetical protein